MTLSYMLCVSKIFERTTDYKRTPYLLDTAKTKFQLSARATVQFQGQLRLPHPSCIALESSVAFETLRLDDLVEKDDVKLLLARPALRLAGYKLLYYWQYKLNGTTNSYKNIKILTINMVILHSFISIYTTTRPPTRVRKTV